MSKVFGCIAHMVVVMGAVECLDAEPPFDAVRCFDVVLPSISFEPALPRTDAGKLYEQELVKKYSAPNLD
jgi:hypothetical protein